MTSRILLAPRLLIAAAHILRLLLSLSLIVLWETGNDHHRIRQRDPHEPEFLQAFEDVVNSLKPVLEQKPYYIEVLQTLAEPEQVHYFRIPWADDTGQQQVSLMMGGGMCVCACLSVHV